MIRERRPPDRFPAASMILIADNIQPANPRVADAMERLDPGPIRDIARRCREAGADLLDINPGFLTRRKQDRMTFLVETVQEEVDLPLVLDSPNPDLLALGLAAGRRKSIVNGLSLEERKIKEIIPLAAEHQTDLVVLLMDERSVPPFRLDEKLNLAIELREHCLAGGVLPEKLIFDPLLPPLSRPDAFTEVGVVLQAVRLFSSGTLFDEEARTVIGLSNLRSGQRHIYPANLETTCLAMLAGAGLSLALANALNPEVAETCRLAARLT